MNGRPAAPDATDPGERKLDEALEETFPASDPIAVTPERPDDEDASTDPKRASP